MTTVSTAGFYERAAMDFNALRSQADTLQAQISTGQKLAHGSDDPLAAAQMRALTRADTLAKVDTTTANTASSDLSLADNALSQVTNTIERLQTLATQAANSTLSSAQRSGIAGEVTQLQQQLLNLANTRDSAGNALFGGQSAGQAYTFDATGNAVYQGTASAASVEIGDGQSVTKGITGPEFLNFSAGGSATSLFAVVKTFNDALTSGIGDPTAAARTALDGLSAGLQAASTAQSVIGARANWIDLNTQRMTSEGTTRATSEATTGGTDIAGAVTQLQQVMTVLQASQASFAKLSSLSLFDVLH